MGEGAGWFLWGGGFALVGALILWATSSWDLRGAALESAWQMARGKRTAKTPTAIEEKLNAIRGEATAFGKARRASTTVIRHFLAQALGLVALVSILIGAILIGVGFYAS